MRNKLEVERVAFRLERDSYMEIDKVLACFPDERANFGRLACISMWFDGNGTAWFDTFDECDLGYYRDNTKPLKDVEMATRCVKALETRYGEKFRIVKRIMWR